MQEDACAIAVDRLAKTYVHGNQSVRAVDAVSFQVRRGEVFGYLGPNGAGKTSTIRMLTGLARPTSGRATVLGLDVGAAMPQIKKRIGVVPETSNLYGELTALDNLVFSMELYGVPRRERVTRAGELLERLGLSGKRDAPFARLSRGMKRALTVAAALSHRPEIVFRDEPTTGLDVMAARSLRRTIAALRDQGITVFLTTHYLEEAERLCDRIGLIVRGQIVALDTVDGLKAQVAQAAAVEVVWRTSTGGTETWRRAAGDVTSAVRTALADVAEVGGQVLSVNTVRPTLQDAFVQLTGVSAADMRAEKPDRRGGGGK